MSRRWVRVRRWFGWADGAGRGVRRRARNVVGMMAFVVLGLPVIMALRGEFAARSLEASWAIRLTSDPAGPPYVPVPGRGTNAAGFHDVERTAVAASGVTRVVVVGDALTWGLEVPRDATFTRVAEDALRADGRSIEVLNFGVPGYDIDAAARMIRTVVPGWSPDRIVYAFTSDDAHPRVLVHPDALGSVRFVGLVPPAGVTRPPAWVLAHSAWMRQRLGLAAQAAAVAAKGKNADRAHVAALEQGVTDVISAAGTVPLAVFTLPPAIVASADVVRCNDHLHSRYGCAWHTEQLDAATARFVARGIPVGSGLTALRTLPDDVAGFGDMDPVNVTIAGHAALGAALAELLR